MAKLPAFQFYPGDWMKDPALRVCSLEARGLWIDLICLMWESEIRGVLVSNGQVWDDDMILKACGVTSLLPSVTPLQELLSFGVASRRDDGAVYCRRMVRDEETREQTRLRVQDHRSRKKGNANVTPMKRPCNTNVQRSSSSSSSSDKNKNAAHSLPATPQAEPSAPSKWMHERSPPHKHEKPNCAPCAVYRLACVAEDVLGEPFSPAFARAAKSLKPHMNLGLEEIERRWRAFLEASREESFLAQNRTISFFASRINAGFGPRISGKDDDPNAKFRALIPK